MNPPLLAHHCSICETLNAVEKPCAVCPACVEFMRFLSSFHDRAALNSQRRIDTPKERRERIANYRHRAACNVPLFDDDAQAGDVLAPRPQLRGRGVFAEQLDGMAADFAASYAAGPKGGAA